MRFLQVTADIVADFKIADAATKEAVADLDGQGKRTCTTPKT